MRNHTSVSGIPIGPVALVLRGTGVEPFMKDLKRSVRRHQQRLAKDRVRKYLTKSLYPNLSDAEWRRVVGKHASTPAICSCSCCGNARRHFGNSAQVQTMQELRHRLREQDLD